MDGGHITVQRLGPPCRLRGGFAQHVGAELHHKVGLLRLRDEGAGEEQAPFAVLPPDQRLDTVDGAVEQVDDRLVVDHEFVLADGAREFVGDPKALR